MTDTRPTGIKLRTLDFTPVLARAAEQHGGTYEVAFGPYAMAEHDGRLYVICSEGVGWGVREDDHFDVDLYGKREGFISILPTLQAKLSPERVRELATGEEVDLADHVRRFGARLESNFWLWHRTLTATPRATQEV